MKKKLKAPIKKGTKIGEMKYYLAGKEIGSKDIVAGETVDEVSYQSALKDALNDLLL